jgi:cold-inducible RNA-binding protein
MDSREAAEAAIATLNGREIDGRALTVNEARPRESRAPRSGGGGGRGFGGGGGGGRGGFNRDRGGRGNRY